MKILGISGSPRQESTSRLVQEVLDATGETTEFISLKGKNIAGCIACLGCVKENTCIVKDDMQQVYEDYWDTVTAKHTAGRAPRTAVRRQQDAYLVDAEGCGYCPLR